MQDLEVEQLQRIHSDLRFKKIAFWFSYCTHLSEMHGHFFRKFMKRTFKKFQRNFCEMFKSFVYSIEMEEKKEELRQMVGRRYRDVLDASSCVRRVTAIANSLADCVHDARTVGNECALSVDKKSNSRTLYRFSALTTLFSLV